MGRLEGDDDTGAKVVSLPRFKLGYQASQARTLFSCVIATNWQQGARLPFWVAYDNTRRVLDDLAALGYSRPNLLSLCPLGRIAKSGQGGGNRTLSCGITIH